MLLMLIIITKIDYFAVFSMPILLMMVVINRINVIIL